MKNTRRMSVLRAEDILYDNRHIIGISVANNDVSLMPDVDNALMTLLECRLPNGTPVALAIKEIRRWIVDCNTGQGSYQAANLAQEFVDKMTDIQVIRYVHTYLDGGINSFDFSNISYRLAPVA